MTKTTAPARPGRERTCTQCGSIYRSPRQSSYCGNACRMKGKRGVKPKAGPKAALSPITTALVKLGMVGPIGPAAVLGLTVPRTLALDEVSYRFNRSGLGYISPAEFDAALSGDGVQRYETDSPAATERKRLQARQRVATARLSVAA